MCCECLLKAGAMVSRKLFSNIWSVLIGKIFALILDMVLVVSVFNLEGDWNEYLRNVFACLYIFYQRGTAILICCCCCTWSQRRKRSILGWNEEELKNQVNTRGQAKTPTTVAESHQSPSNGIELKIAQSPSTGPVLPPPAAGSAAAPVASTSPTPQQAGASEARVSTEKVGKIGDELDISSAEKKTLENNLYWGAHFVGIDLFSKLVVKRVTDGDCSNLDCCYVIIYLILLLGDLFLWFFLGFAFAIYFDDEFGVWITLINVLIAGFIGHLQHYIIIFIAPLKKSNLTDRCACCKRFNYCLFAMLVFVQVVIIIIVLLVCISSS